MTLNFLVVLHGPLGVTSLAGYSTFFLKVTVLFVLKEQDKQGLPPVSLQKVHLIFSFKQTAIRKKTFCLFKQLNSYQRLIPGTSGEEQRSFVATGISYTSVELRLAWQTCFLMLRWGWRSRL